MKSFTTWFCLAITAISEQAIAAQSLEAYRKGNYALAAKELAIEASKDPVGNYYLGLMRLYGYGQLKNNALALRHFTRSAEAGYLPAQRLLGSYYLNKANDPEQAFKWFQKATSANDVQAQMYTAGAYLFGFGVRQNEDLARRYYIEAAKAGNSIAQYTLADQFLTTKNSGNRKMGLIWLTKAAEKNNPKALAKLGEMYMKGDLVSVDKEKAKSLLEQALSKHETSAMVTLGELAQQQGAYPEAKAWFEKAASQNIVAGQFALATLFLDQKSPFFNSQTGFLWMLKAAQNKYKPAELALASMYKEGRGVPMNKSMASQWEAAAKKPANSKMAAKISLAKWLSNDETDNFDKGVYRLGGIYNAWQNPLALAENNYNPAPQMDNLTRKVLFKPQFSMIKSDKIPIDEYFDMLAPTLSGGEINDWSFPHYPVDKRVNSWMKEESLVTSRDVPLFKVEDRVVYEEEPKIKPFDYLEEKIANWQHQANLQVVLSQLYQEAILGVPSSQFQLGQFYEYGIGVIKSVDEAIAYYELAASQQDMRAEYNLGILYLEGKTNPVDYKKGVAWLTDAAFKGNAYAQYVLGNIYEKGLTDANQNMVIAPNHEQAIAMYFLASSNHLGIAEFRLADFLVKEKLAGLSVGAKKERNTLVKRLYNAAVYHGIAEAVLPLAFYHAMDSDFKKQLHAFYVAKREAANGNPEAALLLGIMYDRGIATAPNLSESLYWYNHAGINPVNAFILGTNYSLGIGLEKDLDKGRYLLQLSADKGFAYANLNLAILNYEQGKPFLDELNKARVLGNAKAGLLLADYYLWQANDAEKIKIASDIYRFFAEKGDRDAETKLAFLYDRGLAGEVNNAQAADWYTRAAEQGQPVAQYLLGLLHQLGRVEKEPNYPEAKKWLMASKKHFTPASVALGFIFDTVDNDYASAFTNYQMAAEKGDAIGQYNLGLIYENGKGAPVDFSKALSLYTEAAKQGHAKAMTQLATMYFKGVDGQKDRDQAIAWYKKAAELEEQGALYQLGLLSETGVGLAQNDGDAVNYYQKAATLGNDKAKLALARMYRYGIGVAQNYQHAADLYKELAAGSNGYAQYQLAILYRDGLLGEPQPNLAKTLFQQAAENGYAGHWVGAGQDQKSSYIEPVEMKEVVFEDGQAADLIYLDALSEWNRGNETLSRRMLGKLIQLFPDYEPAKRIKEKLGSLTVG